MMRARPHQVAHEVSVCDGSSLIGSEGSLALDSFTEIGPDNTSAMIKTSGGDRTK
jgi:hypothetical protein